MALGYLTGAPAFGWVYDLFLIVVAWVTGFLTARKESLVIERFHEVVLSARVPNRITLTFENRDTQPLRVRIRDEAPPSFICDRREFQISLKPGGSMDATYWTTPPERGDDHFRGTYARFHCPLGLVEKQLVYNTETPVRVYPNVLAMNEFELLNQRGRLREIGVRKSRMRGLGTEFESLRDYSIGDDYRKIDWKATGRRGKIIVRQYEVERNQTVLLTIDIGRHMIGEINGIPKLDSVLDACLMLSRAAFSAGDQVGLLVYADKVVRFIPPAKSRNQIGAIVEALHDLVALPVESSPVQAYAYLGGRWKRRSFLVAFTDAGDRDRAKSLGISLQSMVRRHLVLLARISDPMLKKALLDPMVSTTDFYRRASGIMIDEDRRDATTVLSTMGIKNLESEPQDLASALVSYYFDVKERALI